MATGDGSTDLDMADDRAATEDKEPLLPSTSLASASTLASLQRFNPRANEAENPVPAAVMPEDGADEYMVGSDADHPGGDGDEEDSVVREIDVYFTPCDDHTKLYVMEYPLRPSWRPLKLHETCKEIRVKPSSSEFEVDLHVDTQSENYDQEATAPLRLEKQTLSSSKLADVADYAIGLIKGNSVHLSHIEAVLQLRPSMSHMNVDTSVSMIQSVKGNEGLKDSERAEKIEPWTSLTYHQVGSDVASSYIDRMVSNESGPIEFTMTKSDYVTSLCPQKLRDGSTVSKIRDIRAMISLPLEVRLRRWFTEVSEVNQFDALMHLAPNYSEGEILKMLPEYASLVQGLWVCKSTLLFNDTYASKRDTILLEFTKGEAVHARVIDRAIRIDDPKRERILLPLCKRRRTLGDYKFISEADQSFIRRYPHVFTEQCSYWSSVRADIEKLQRHSIPALKASTNSNLNGYKVHSILTAVFADRKVCSMKSIIKDINTLAGHPSMSDAASYCASMSKHELNGYILKYAVSVHGVYVATQSGTSLRNLLIKIFSNKEPNATVTMKEILDKAKAEKIDIPTTDFIEILYEICEKAGDDSVRLQTGD